MTKTTLAFAVMGTVLLAGFCSPVRAADPRYPGSERPAYPAGPGAADRRPGTDSGPPAGPGAGPGAGARPGCLIWTGTDLDCNFYYDQCSGASWKKCGAVWTQK